MSQMSSKQLESTVGGVVVLIFVVTGIAYTSRRVLNKPDNTDKQIELIKTNPLASTNPLGGPQGGPPIPQPGPQGGPPIQQPGPQGGPPIQQPGPQGGIPPIQQPGPQGGIPPIQQPNPQLGPQGGIPPNQQPNPQLGPQGGIPPIQQPGPQGRPSPNPSLNQQPGQPPLSLLASSQGSSVSPSAKHPLEVEGELIILVDGTTIGRLETPPLSQPDDILRVMVGGQFHSLLIMPPFSEGGREIFFDPTRRAETDAPQRSVDRPPNFFDEDDPNVDPFGSAPSLVRPTAPLRSDVFGSTPSLSRNTSDPSVGRYPRASTLDPVSELSQGSGFESSQDSTFGGIDGGKKTKTKKKPKKRTRKYHKIMNQVKKLLKEV